MKDGRQALIKQLEEMTDADVYILFTASGEQEYDVSYDFLPLFTDAIYERRGNGRTKAILIMETNGGDPTTAMAVIRQLRECYKTIEGYAFNRCFSAGTLGMFGTDKIFMSRYAMLTPIDAQCLITDQARYSPVMADFIAFMDRIPDNREREFAAMYPEQYAIALRVNRYAIQTVFPNFQRHCKPSYLDMAWDYFNGGAGIHSTKIGRSQARELGLRIYDMSRPIEELLYGIINDYIKETDMLRDSLAEMDAKDAYFETLGLTYVHYAKYQEEPVENAMSKAMSSAAKDEECDIPEKKKLLGLRMCIEYGWKKE